MSSTAKGSVLEGLVSWLASKKVQTDKLAAVERLSDGKAVLATSRNLPAGDVVLSIPEDLWLTPAAAQRSLRDVAGLEPWLQVALLLLSERTTPSGAGAFSPYVTSLPDLVDSPLFWTRKQLSLLAGTQLLVSVEGYRAFFEAKHAELRPVFARLGLTGPAASYESFLWAAATVRGRLHAPLEDEQAALVPGADAVSHRRRGNVAWAVRSAGLFGRGRALCVETTRTMARGEELAMDYGAVGGRAAGRKLDSVVLLDYGVVDSQGLQPGYLLTLELPETERFIDDKRDILELSGMTQVVGPLSAAFELRPGQAPPEEMLGFLRLLHLSGGDAFLLESIFRQQAWGFMVDPVSETNEAAVCQSMAAGAREALAGYPTTIDEDLALLRGGAVEPGSREEMAVQIRLGEKEALDGTLTFFEERLQNLKRLTYYQERRLRRLGLMDEAGGTTYDGFFKDGIA